MKRKLFIIFILITLALFTAVSIYITTDVTTSNGNYKDFKIFVGKRAVDAYNSERYADYLVVYTEDYERNAYGYELLVERDTGFVIDADSSVIIMDGAYVISGHGVSAQFLRGADIGDIVVLSDDYISIERDIRKSNLKKLELEMERIDNIINHKKENLFDINSDGIEYADKEIEKNFADFKLYCESPDVDADVIASKASYIIELLEYKYYCSIESNAVEGRAMWHRPNNSAIDESNIDGVEELVSYISRLGINTLYVETYWHGMTTYYSNVISGQHPRMASFDYGEYGDDYILALISECHKQGIEVHAWVELVNVGLKDWALPTHIRNDWLCIDNSDSKSRFLDPANEQALSYLCQVVEEMLERYDFDGINCDYVRYSEAGESIFALTDEMKCEAVTKLIKSISTCARNTKKDIVVSVSPYGYLDNALSIYKQDTRAWLEKGYVDVVVPMIYTENADLLLSTVRDYYEYSDKALQYTGISPLYNGSDLMMHQELIETIENSYVGGFSLFASQSYITEDIAENERILSAMSNGVGRVRAIPPTADIHKVIKAWLAQLTERCNTIYLEHMTDNEVKQINEFLASIEHHLEKDWNLEAILVLVEDFKAHTIDFQSDAVSKRICSQIDRIYIVIKYAFKHYTKD